MKLDDYTDIDSAWEARLAARLQLNKSRRPGSGGKAGQGLSDFVLYDSDYVEYQVPGHEPIGPCYVWLWSFTNNTRSPSAKHQGKNRTVAKLICDTPKYKYTIHLCQNTLCVRKAHLKITEGRGNLVGYNKLVDAGILPPYKFKKVTKKMCQEMRELYEAGYTQTEIAEMYEVSVSTAHGHIWGKTTYCTHCL